MARFRGQVETQLINLGAAIEEARKAKRWSRARLAREIPVDPKTIERWERGTSGGAMESLGPIAQALDTSAEELLEGAIARGRPETNGDLMDELRQAESGPLKSVEDQLASLRADLLVAVAEVRTDLEDLRSLIEQSERGQGG